MRTLANSITDKGMALVRDSDGTPVLRGDVLRDFRGVVWTVLGGYAPKHGGSTGRVEVIAQGDSASHHYYPGVVNCHWQVQP